MAQISRLVTGGNLTSEQYGRVLIESLKDVGIYPIHFNDLCENFVREQNTDYRLGLRNGDIVVAYVMNLRPMLNDPNVVAAAELANSLSITGKVSTDDIGGALINMLFHDVATRRMSVK